MKLLTGPIPKLLASMNHLDIQIYEHVSHVQKYWKFALQDSTPTQIYQTALDQYNMIC